MKPQANKTASPGLQQQIKQIEEEINDLKMKLLKPHISKSAEQDYEIKSHIIEKQNEMIELLIKLSNLNAKR